LRLEETDVDALAGRLCALIESLPGLAKPMLVLDAEGKAADVTPFAYLTRADMENRPMASFSEAQEAYFRTRDRAERIHQKASSLSRVLKNNIDALSHSCCQLAIDTKATCIVATARSGQG
ncbi:MAG: NFACT family protein, partial [Oscillospiraceae bacterium]|nr:NFACT family protein [Oscillospiraceae bacterium]